MKNFIPILKPVSYTHLDVYKRQHEDCTTTILNGKILNLLDEMPSIEGVEAFRLNFTIETAEEVARVITAAKRKLDGSLEKSVFNQNTDTRGHFNKEIL